VKARRGRARAALAAAGAAATFACAQARDIGGDVAHVLNPFSGTEVSVQSVSVLEPYLLFEIASRRENLRLLAPATPACAALLRPEARVRYQKSGVFGRVQDGESHCDVAGVASLEAWRNRQPRTRTANQVVPRATARFTHLGGDERHILVRGRFPLASRVQIPAGFDLVAMLPANDACREAVARGELSMEFRPAGREPFRLIVSGQSCVIEGFATPV
jgi:hypothetical protein